MSLAVILQSTQTLQSMQPLETTTTAPADDKLLLIELLMKGGPIMIPIAVLLVVSIYIWIYKFFIINKASKVDERMIPSIKDQLTMGNLAAAESYARNMNTSQARVIESGLGTLGRSMREIESNLETSSNIEIMELEKNLGYLGTIAGIAPMLGFIGTIAGVIRVFYDISVSGEVEISIISAGLYEKMVTSGFGLLTGIIAYSGYHLLNMKIDRFALKLQKTAFDFIRIINKAE